MQNIPLNDAPSQILSVTLGGQACRLRLFTRDGALYLDLYIADVLTVSGAPCLRGVPVVRAAHLGLAGDLVFRDSQGLTDPSSPGLGSRYQLVYLEAAELAAIIG